MNDAFKIANKTCLKTQIIGVKCDMQIKKLE